MLLSRALRAIINLLHTAANRVPRAISKSKNNKIVHTATGHGNKTREVRPNPRRVMGLCSVHIRIGLSRACFVHFHLYYVRYTSLSAGLHIKRSKHVKQSSGLCIYGFSFTSSEQSALNFYYKLFDHILSCYQFKKKKKIVDITLSFFPGTDC